MQEATPGAVNSQPLLSAVEAFFRRRRLFSFVAAAVLVAVALVTFTAKKEYRSETKLLLENNRSNTVITADRSSSPMAVEITEQQLSTELEVLRSDDVIGSVADPGWSSIPAATRTPAALKAHEQRLRAFRKHLSVEPAHKANVIIISYAASSPAQATGVLEQYSAAYLGRRKLLSRPSGTSGFFAEEARRYENAWHNANQELVSFQQLHQIVSVEQAENAVNKQVQGYEDDLRTNDARLAEMNMRLTAGTRAAREVPQRQRTQEHTVVNETSTEQMRTLLVQLQNRRTELLTRYTPRDRLVAEVDRQIAETRASLGEAIAQKAHEDTTDVNPAWQQVQSSLIQGKIDRQALQSENAAITQSLNALRARLAEIQSLDVPFNALQQKADEARSNFEMFSEKRDQAQIEDAMDEHKLINVAIAESPTSSFQPVYPRPMMNGLLGALTALFLGAAAVYLAESVRSTVGSARELEMVSRFPVLATFSREWNRRDIPRTQMAGKQEERRYSTSRVTHISATLQNYSESRSATSEPFGG